MRIKVNIALKKPLKKVRSNNKIKDALFFHNESTNIAAVFTSIFRPSLGKNPLYIRGVTLWTV